MSKAAERVLSVLRTVILAQSPLGVMEIATTSGLNKSTCSRLVRLLEVGEYIEKNPESGKYHAGPTTLGLMATAAKNSELVSVMHPYLERIRGDTHETASLHLRLGTERLCIDAVDTYPPDLTRLAPLGERKPLYLGTSGRIMLAFLDDSTIERASNVAKDAGEDPESLQRQLELARKQRFLFAPSYQDGRHVTLSAPLIRQNSVVAALTVTGLRTRWTLDSAALYAPKLVEHAAMASSVLTHTRMFIPGTALEI